ncbi:MAG: rhomboid family intramembrane serine protease [Bacteroidia bacterium]|nr:rhomboid family intramembrane serine protease [Bacteroidia bacterium]MBT8310688.1 rhomboid family intramembrane serine protease [Bacteroidia bacterium]NND11690.1 rhomboid family intramembrane serine protease [Flavobacteriaceae bacterium]NNL61402.1 rhomboid family intramembrane serine protease [Flavobacteriaceae bacterium]RZV67279.1 MAG: rhomboid family intramembrane serine protease [Flavobacteriaceae bacterium]
MSEQGHFKFSTGVIAYPIVFVLLIWIVFWFEIRFGLSFNSFGINPGKLLGLRGIVFSPFIHSGIDHLYNNTIPLFVLSTALFYFYRKIAWKVVIFGILLSGLLTWVIGRPANHIGVSGFIYVLVSFTFFKGIFAKHYRLIALSLIVVFLYGSMVWGTLPIQEGISWEGHLSGMLTGLLFAIIFRKEIAKPKKFIWEEEHYNEEDDEFMKHFDEDGNFIEDLDTENADEEQRIKYHFKSKND